MYIIVVAMLVAFFKFKTILPVMNQMDVDSATSLPSSGSKHPAEFPLTSSAKNCAKIILLES